MNPFFCVILFRKYCLEMPRDISDSSFALNASPQCISIFTFTLCICL